MSSDIDRSKIDLALDQLRPGLNSDGFDVRSGDFRIDGILEIVLEAGVDACNDCLVPDEVLIRIIEDCARSQGLTFDHVELKKIGFDSIRD